MNKVYCYCYYAIFILNWESGVCVPFPLLLHETHDSTSLALAIKSWTYFYLTFAVRNLHLFLLLILDQ